LLGRTIFDGVACHTFSFNFTESELMSNECDAIDLKVDSITYKFGDRTIS